MRLCMVGCGVIADRHAAAIRVANADHARAAAVAAGARPPPPPLVTVTATVDTRADAAGRLAAHFSDHGAVAFQSVEEALELHGSSIDAVLLMVHAAPPSPLTVTRQRISHSRMLAGVCVIVCVCVFVCV